MRFYHPHQRHGEELQCSKRLVKCLQNGTTIDCSFNGTIAPARCRMQVVVTPAGAATSLTAMAQVLGQGIADSNLANNQASEVTPIGTAPRR